MSKRKLSRQQAWRIEKIQQEKAARAAKKAAKLDSAVDRQALGEEMEGLITAHYGTQVAVESINKDSAANTETHSIHRCHFRTNLGSLVTGDRVIWQPGNPYGVVVAVLPRQSELSRPDIHKQTKVIAANIDRIMITIAPIPKPHSQLIDRYIVAAETIGIEPVLVINKIDLVDDANRSNIEAIADLYVSLGYTVIQASTKAGHGLDALNAQLHNHTCIFVGQSGVGKSSLINMLIPDLDLQVGAVSDYNQKGTHTTTLSQLFHFPHGGQLIDSPGIREFGLWDMDPAVVIEGFIEFRPFIGHCKFRDCKHKHEPGCAILQAYEDGHINPYRMDSYQALIADIESRQD